MAKITQPDLYLFEIDSHDIVILDAALCALQDKINSGTHKFGDKEPEAQKRLDSMLNEVVRIRRDGHDCV